MNKLDIHNVVLGAIACSLAGIGAWLILISLRYPGRSLPLSAMKHGLEMPPAQREALREMVINSTLEGRGGYWSPEWGRPTGRHC
jgi:hypothetical protein